MNFFCFLTLQSLNRKDFCAQKKPFSWFSTDTLFQCNVFVKSRSNLALSGWMYLVSKFDNFPALSGCHLHFRNVHLLNRKYVNQEHLRLFYLTRITNFLKSRKTTLKATLQWFFSTSLKSSLLTSTFQKIIGNRAHRQELFISCRAIIKVFIGSINA